MRILDCVSEREGEKSFLRPLISKCLLLRIDSPSLPLHPNNTRRPARALIGALYANRALVRAVIVSLGCSCYLHTSCMTPTPHLSATNMPGRIWLVAKIRTLGSDARKENDICRCYLDLCASNSALPELDSELKEFKVTVTSKRKK